MASRILRLGTRMRVLIVVVVQVRVLGAERVAGAAVTTPLSAPDGIKSD